MDTLYLLCDSITTLINGSPAFVCQPLTEKAGANSYNDAITDKICGTLVILAAITVIAVLLWELIGFWTESSKAKRERAYQIEDVKRKQIAEYRNKELDLLKEDKEKCLSKLDDYLKSLENHEKKKP